MAWSGKDAGSPIPIGAIGNGVQALIPSATTAGFWRSKVLLERLDQRGICATIIANSRVVESLCCEHKVHHVTTGTNLGFGRAINAAVAELKAWTVLLIVNDDITLTSHAADILADSIQHIDTTRPNIVSYDATAVDRLPGTWSVFFRLSLLSAILNRLRRTQTVKDTSDRRLLEPPFFAGFSIIGITRSAWRDLGGFNSSLPFYFEDAEFTSRFRSLLTGSIEVLPVGAEHDRSATARLFTRELCSVAAWSGCAYLESRGTKRAQARAIGIAAMIVRLVIVLLSLSGSHAVGCLSAIGALVRGAEPALPSYDQFD